MKNNNKVLKESSVEAKKPYEPCGMEIVLLKEDVLLASIYPTKGTYEDLGEWNPFKGTDLW